MHEALLDAMQLPRTAGKTPIENNFYNHRTWESPLYEGALAFAGSRPDLVRAASALLLPRRSPPLTDAGKRGPIQDHPSLPKRVVEGNHIYDGLSRQALHSIMGQTGNFHEFIHCARLAKGMEMVSTSNRIGVDQHALLKCEQGRGFLERSNFEKLVTVYFAGQDNLAQRAVDLLISNKLLIMNQAQDNRRSIKEQNEGMPREYWDWRIQRYIDPGHAIADSKWKEDAPRISQYRGYFKAMRMLLGLTQEGLAKELSGRGVAEKDIETLEAGLTTNLTDHQSTIVGGLADFFAQKQQEMFAEDTGKPKAERRKPFFDESKFPYTGTRVERPDTFTGGGGRDPQGRVDGQENGRRGPK